MFIKIYEWIKNFIKCNYKEIIFLVIFAFVCLYQLPYFVYKPGGSINLASRVIVEGKEDINGSYSMNYVTVSRGNIPTLIAAKIIKDWEIVKEQTVVPSNIDYETSFKLEQLEYKNAIFMAIYNACKINNACEITLNKEQVYIISISEEAKTDLKALDQIVSMDGKEVNSFMQIKDYISSKKVGDVVKFMVLSNGKETEKSAEVIDMEGSPKIGVSGYTTYDYDTDPKIDIITRNSEAGPSGGLILTLAVYDHLIDEDIANGRKIMGTGTIDELGNIGAIGAIKYKMLGAKKDKADIFFAPYDNCDEANEVKKEYNIKYTVKCVKTFDEAVNFLTTNK